MKTRLAACRPFLLATALLSAVPLSASTVRNDGGRTSYRYSPGGKLSSHNSFQL